MNESMKHVLCSEGEDSDNCNLDSSTTWQEYPVRRVISKISIANIAYERDIDESVLKLFNI
jgi:hypothetical protein